MNPDNAAEASATPERQSLSRLHAKTRSRGGFDGSDPSKPYSAEDLVQLQYALAKRDLEDRLRADLKDRERLVEAHLGVPWRTIAVASETIQDPHIKPVLRLIGRQLREHEEVEFAGAHAGSPSRWDRFEVGDDVELVPGWATIYWDAGTVSDGPLVLETWSEPVGQNLMVFSRAEDQPLGKAYLNRLIKDAKGPESPYRGRLLKASWGGHGVQLEILRDPTETRERIVLPSAIWESLDINVHQMVAKMKAFEAAGLGSNRGVLLAGAPGTGKTAACRVLAQEALGSVTAVFVDSIVAESLLPQLYTTISDMAPALLFLEDLDLIVGSRRNRSVRRSLLNFLTVLDGLMTQHHDVITVATTNDPEAVDAAVRRAARFDRVVTFPLPDERDRQRILEVYLRSFDHQVDTREVAGVTAGKTGADLREYIRTALLGVTASLGTNDLLAVIQDEARQGASSDRPPGTRPPYL
jgi:hypothetical protein